MKTGKAGLPLKRFMLACVLAVGLGGCNSLRTPPPEAPPLPARWIFVEDNANHSPAAPSPRGDGFWYSLGDPALPALLATALRHNAEVKFGVLQSRLARLQAAFAGLSRWPSTSLSFSAGLARPLSHPAGTQPQTVRTASTAFTAGYPLDLWGKEQATREAATLLAHASERDVEAIRLAICVSVAEARWQIGFLHRVQRNAQADLKEASQNVWLAQVRYEAGAISGGDVLFARQALALRQNALSVIQQDFVEARLAFDLLLGTSTPDELADLQDTPLPTPRAGLPVQILARRADVHAAELRVRSSLAEADAVRLGFYPSFNLTASYGTLSPTLTQYFTDPLGALGATLALPFIQFNTARFSRKSAYLVFEANRVNFINQLQTALKEVEQALSARQQLMTQRIYQQEALALSQETENLTYLRWQRGSTDIQLWLDAKSARRQAQLGLLQNVLARKINAVRLYAALGGHSPAEPAID